jgi:putative glutamine amidotransferase
MNADLEKDRLVLRREYFEAVGRAGGLPVVLPPATGRRAVRRQLMEIDALVLTGGDDYRPSLYGKRSHPEVTLVRREREEYDLALVREAYARSIPVLAVCGGMQLVAIARGGSLVVHVEGHRKTYHGVRVEGGSALARVVRARRLRVNSSHHQAVEHPGRGVRAVGFATDGTVEALERTDGAFLLAVQWHPERMRTTSTDRLFEALVRTARRREP